MGTNQDGSKLFQVAGFSLLRILSDRERSKVYLAKDSSNEFRAVKLQRPTESSALPGISARYKRLQRLTAQNGLLPVLSHGFTDDGWFWESLPLADNLPGLPPVEGPAGLEQYTPLTLRAWSTEHGPAPAKEVARWGLRLAGALGLLHADGLVHRDVKPTNILLVHGEPCLGDYGLVGEPGGPIDFSGTEGFQPFEGTSDAAADLFALGKTLYEIWTGGDRLEYPSLPRPVLDSPDWAAHGHHLNQVILRACHAQARQRFRSATELGQALSNVVAGRRPINRRRWLVAAGSTFVMAAGTLLLSKVWRPPARVVWRRVREKGFEVEGWLGNPGTVDWNRRRMYSFRGYKNAFLFQSVDLDSFKLAEMEIPGGPTEDNTSSILHPETRQLWMMVGGCGEVFALDPDTGVIKSLGGGPHDHRHYGAATYWNPVTRRVGIFGGYGQFAVTNDRSEFDEASRHWIEVEPDRRSSDLWPRGVELPLTPDSTGKRIYLVGGSGNPSGQQGQKVKGLRGFTGHFHLLDDIWELNLETNFWRQLLPLGQLEPLRLRAVVYHPRLQGLLFFQGMQPDDAEPRPPEVLLFRPGVDRRPVKLRVEGQASRLPQSARYWSLDPQNGEVLVLAEDGVFRVSVEPI